MWSLSVLAARAFSSFVSFPEDLLEPAFGVPADGVGIKEDDGDVGIDDAADEVDLAHLTDGG